MIFFEYGEVVWGRFYIGKVSKLWRDWLKYVGNYSFVRLVGY